MITRFAPSPTGPLHLGHAFSAMLAFDRARQRDGICLLRIEDIDRERCKPEWEALIYEDLHWLGLNWPEPVMRQSERSGAYQNALDRLSELGVLYPCRCTRGDIRAALSAPQEGVPVAGPDGPVYPGTCRGRHMKDAGPQDSLRLNMVAACDLLSRDPRHHETGDGTAKVHTWTRALLIEAVGDIVLARRGLGTSYHLSVVVDDAAQGITEVVRGKDLFEATSIHLVLQHLLDLPTPDYHHHRLIRDETGKRLAKRDDARAISRYRDEGVTPAELRQRLGLDPLGS